MKALFVKKLRSKDCCNRNKITNFQINFEIILHYNVILIGTTDPEYAGSYRNNGFIKEKNMASHADIDNYIC